MKLTLTDDDGIVVETWVVEDEFAATPENLVLPFPATALAEEISNAWKRCLNDR